MYRKFEHRFFLSKNGIFSLSPLNGDERKYFNAIDVVGKQLTFLDTIPLTITGVFKNWSSNAHLQLNMIASFSTYEKMGMNLETWRNNIYYTYVLLQERASPALFKSKIPAFLDKHIRSLPNRQQYQLVAQNLKDIHLHSQKDMEWSPNGSITTVYIFGGLALIILLIAGINFMNLSTAIATRRAKEIGVRKTIGARISQLVGQFLFESVFMSMLALTIALLIVKISLPYLNQLANKTLTISTLLMPTTIAGLLGFTILVGLLAGFYPALVLSSFRPLDVLKGTIKTKLQEGLMRKGLVVLQFGLSLFLLVSSLVIYQQLDFMKNKSLGFDKEQVLVLPYAWDGKVQQAYELLKERFLQLPAIQYVTRSGDIPGRMATRMGYWAEGMPEDESRGIQALYVDKDFVPVYGIEVIAGRAINNTITSDLENGYLLNERAVAHIGWTAEEAIGKRFTVHKEGSVIGVVKDFHYNSLQQAVQPLFLSMRPDWAGYMSLRIHTNEVDKTIQNLETIWKELVPDRPFRHVFLEEDYNRQYLAENRLGKIVIIFTGLAIFIACIGLFGLATFTIERRNREIAVRKVLGASVAQVVVLLSKDFIRPILIALLLAAPLSFWLAQQWLNNFAYQITFNPLWLVAGAFLLLLIAWISLGFQSIKAAVVNPINWLKEE